MVRKMNFEILVRQVENGVIINESLIKEIKVNKLLCARYFSPPLRQMRSPLHTNFFAAICHPPF